MSYILAAHKALLSLQQVRGRVRPPLQVAEPVRRKAQLPLLLRQRHHGHRHGRHGCQMAIAGFFDRMCLALRLLDYGSAMLRCKI